MYDQFVVFYFFDLSSMKLPLVALELCLKLFIVVILHLKHNQTMYPKNQYNMGC